MVITMRPKLLVHCLLWTAAAALTNIETRSSESLLRSATPSFASLPSTDNVNPQHLLGPRVAPQSVLEDIEPPPACAVSPVSNSRSPHSPHNSNGRAILECPAIRFVALSLLRLTYVLNL